MTRRLLNRKPLETERRKESDLTSPISYIFLVQILFIWKKKALIIERITFCHAADTAASQRKLNATKDESG